jgi:DNA-binding winged helix-turn-helix (wHTH) protein/predicted ATPase
MTDTDQIWFAPFRLDVLDEVLWHEDERLALSPKAFALLRYLAEHTGQLVSKAALLEAVWPGTVVGDAVLTVGIAELRKALGDNPRAPRFIETIHRRGYRFVAAVRSPKSKVQSQEEVVSSREQSGVRRPMSGVKNSQSAIRLPPPLGSNSLAPSIGGQAAFTLVGRDPELVALHQLLEKALRGERQIVFITGEAGSGKTALVDTFRQGLEAGDWLRTLSPQAPSLKSLASPVRFAHGQCVEHYSAGEAYLPVLDALTRLCRAPDGTEILNSLRRYAPTWLLQMPTLLSPTERDALRQQGYATTRERMVRELADAIIAFCTQWPLVLVFEDLHWSDYSTLDFLSTLTRRPEPARLLVIGTYRLGDVLRRRHPLRALQQELQAHQSCVVLPLASLTGTDIATHLNARLPRHRFPAAFPDVVYQRTNGNPLFLVNMLEELQAQTAIVERGGHWDLTVDVDTVAARTPATIRSLIEQHVERLPLAEQQVLEGASVAGVEFTVDAVAAALGISPSHVEELCEHLARHGQFLRPADVRTLPGGTMTAQYAFVHALYQETMYNRIGAARRIRWHQSIAHWLETVAGEQASEIAAELAVHCKQGRDYERAGRYLEHAARKALRRGAAYEAIRHLRTALQLLQTAPQTTVRTEREFTLQTLLAPALMATRGYDAAEIEQIYDRVRALAQQVGESPRAFPVLTGVAAFHLVRGKYDTAHEIATQLLQMARCEQEPGLLVEAHALMGIVAFYRGEFIIARTQLEQSMGLYDPQQHRGHVVQYGQDPWVVCCSYLAWTLWTLGYPDQAQARSQEALAYAQELQHPMSCAFALGLAGILQNVCCNPEAGYQRAEELIALASEQGFPYWVAQGMLVRGRALVQSGRATEGLAQIHQIIQARREKDGLGRRSPLALAEVYIAAGETEAGFRALTEACTRANSGGERYWEAEVYRLKGELLLSAERGMQNDERKMRKQGGNSSPL